ncbi:MAG: hypothetical protein HZC28_05945 [Spirochaetes bacterium]|nr:hypothetical protein [Spirochaetota bacterium]
MNLHGMSKARFLAGAAALSLLIGCATTDVYFTVKRPSQISMKGHKRIAMGSFTGKNPAHVGKLVSFLEADMIDSKAFDAVLDRKYMNDVLKEHNLQMTGLFNEKSLASVGKFIGAGAIVYGSIDDENYREEQTSKEKITVTTNITKKDPKDRTTWVTTITTTTNIINTRTGTVTLNVTFQVVDIETAKLSAVKPIPMKRDFVKTAVDAMPAKIDAEEAIVSTMREAAGRFVRMLTPYSITVRAEFQKDGELQDLEAAVNKMKAGLMEEAVKDMLRMAGKPYEKPEVKGKAYYNLGMAQCYAGEYDDALANVKKAMEWNPSEQLYIQAIQMVKAEKASADKLKEQDQ